MEITLGWIFVITFVSSRLPSAVSIYVSGLDIKNGTFQILQQHPQIKKCAESVLQEDRYVGCRVSELTGQCQGLIHSWGLKQTIEQGYAYAKKMFVQETFTPFAVVKFYGLGWKIPVVFNTGAQIDITMSNWNPDAFENVHFTLTNVTNESGSVNQHGVWVNTWISRTSFEFLENIGNNTAYNTTRYGRFPVSVRSKEVYKFSFLAQPNSLTIFVDDEEVTRFELSIQARIMRMISVYTQEDPVFIHGIKFTGK